MDNFEKPAYYVNEKARAIFRSAEAVGEYRVFTGNNQYLNRDYAAGVWGVA